MRRCSRCGSFYDGEHGCGLEQSGALAARVAHNHQVAGSIPASATNTYRYRDVDKRRTYMRDYMRKRRARSGTVQVGG